MGLTLFWTKNYDDEYEMNEFPEELSFICSFNRYFDLRTEILKAVNSPFLEVWKTLMTDKYNKETFEAAMDKLSEENPGLCLFICHPDCCGDFFPDECKVVYKALAGINVPQEYREDLRKLTDSFKYCADNKTVLLYRKSKAA